MRQQRQFITVFQTALTSLYTIDYSSQLTLGVCTATNNCPDKAFDGNIA